MEFAILFFRIWCVGLGVSLIWWIPLMSVPSVNFKMTRTCIKKAFVLLWSLQFLMDQLLLFRLDASHQIPALSKSRVFLLNISWFGMNVMYLILSVEGKYLIQPASCKGGIMWERTQVQQNFCTNLFWLLMVGYNIEIIF